jgi:glyoxalase family protein
MNSTIPGIHHVTAIAADPQRNLDFYTQVLGLRLVKLTVNFDDPQTYHFYFGDSEGRPGTLLTFFPWPAAPRGRSGTGQVTTTSFAVAAESLGYWMERLAWHSVAVESPSTRFHEELLSFEDPDGLRLELVGVPNLPGPEVQAFHSVTLSVEGYERTAGLLAGAFEYRPAGESGNRFRFVSAQGGRASIVDVVCLPDARRGSTLPGTVHHVAFRVPDGAAQKQWREKVFSLGFNVTPVIDRTYFQSIYFREPGGVLFELATDPPGFTVDEDPAGLGTSLRLPRQYEPMRERLEGLLPKLRLPGAGNAADDQ